MFDTSLAVLFVKMKDRFRVAMRFIPVPTRFERLTEVEGFDRIHLVRAAAGLELLDDSAGLGIDDQDAVFSKLRLWTDANHDGISQPNELHTLPELGIHSLSISYFDSSRTDEFGNQFRFKARVNPRKEHRDGRDEMESGEVGRWAYDVFFVTK